jgi:hypothetical protein
MRRSTLWLPAIAAAAILAACGGGGGGTSGGTGTLSVKLTDAPACGYDHVWVTVTKVRVHKSDTAGDSDPGWSEVLVDPAKSRIDLLGLQNGVLADLGQTALPEGRYQQVRLVLADNKDVAGANQLVLTSDKSVVNLDTPSAQQSGLKLKHGFDVAAGTEVDLVLDFDACKSIVKAGNSGKYNLKPVVSVIPILVGSIAGAVDPEAARAAASVSLQRFDPATGVVSVVRATTVRADGTWTLAPVPVSPATGPGYNLVIGSPGYANVVFTNVPVQTAVTTPVPAVALTTSTARLIDGTILPAGDGSVQALQTVVDNPGTDADVVVEAAYANADGVTGDYLVTVPAGAARVAPYAASSPTYSAGANAGKYTVRASDGATTQDKPADVGAGDATVDFVFP